MTRPHTVLLLVLMTSPFALPALAPLSSMRGEPVKPGCVVPSIVTRVGDRRQGRGRRNGLHAPAADVEGDQVGADIGVGVVDGLPQ